jgi:hypothetical protein
MDDSGHSDYSLQAEALTGAGRGAVIGAMAGAGWLGWGLGNAKAYNGYVAPAFGFTALFLFACSVYFLREGRRLRKQYPIAGASTRQAILKWFLVVFAIEAAAIVLAVILANRLHRADLGTNWCAMIVGLHFLPLARIFRAPNLVVLGILITLWCVLCWVLFEPGMIGIAASLGTGILFWGRCVFSLFRARKIARSLRT